MFTVNNFMDNNMVIGTKQSIFSKGALLGTKLYTDFSNIKPYEGDKFNEGIEKLVLEIERAGIKPVVSKRFKNMYYNIADVQYVLT